MNKLFKKAGNEENNVGWAFSPTMKLCWGRNPNLHKNCDDLIGKKSINSSPCHPEIAAPLVADEKEAYKGGGSQSISGSYHQQKCSANCSQKSNVGGTLQETPTYNNISLNTNERSIIGQCLSHHSPRRIAFTLAEVFSPYYCSPRKAAFTLAEVLITLGVIGVVAAMTLPALIQNYEKMVTVNRLKVTFNIMSNAIRMAEAHNGEIGEWDLVSNARKEYEAASDKALRVQIAKEYILPYLNAAQLTETTTLAQMGYKTPFAYPDGSIYAPVTAAGPAIRLNNGTIILLAGQLGSVPDPTTGKQITIGMTFYMDIDGPKGKNTIGKDIFVAALPFANKTKFMMDEKWTLTGSGSGNLNMIKVESKNRDDLIRNCKERPNYCGRLIQADGWEIKDDYPWW